MTEVRDVFQSRVGTAAALPVRTAISQRGNLPRGDVMTVRVRSKYIYIYLYSLSEFL